MPPARPSEFVALRACLGHALHSGATNLPEIPAFAVTYVAFGSRGQEEGSTAHGRLE